MGGIDDQLLGTTCVYRVGAERRVQGAADSAGTQVHTVATLPLPELRDSDSTWQTSARESDVGREESALSRRE